MTRQTRLIHAPPKRANVHGSAHRPDQRSSQNKTDQKCSATKVAHVPLWRLKHRRMALATVNAARRSLWPNQSVAWIKDMLGMVGHTSTLTQPFPVDTPTTWIKHPRFTWTQRPNWVNVQHKMPHHRGMNTWKFKVPAKTPTRKTLNRRESSKR